MLEIPMNRGCLCTVPNKPLSPVLLGFKLETKPPIHVPIHTLGRTLHMLIPIPIPNHIASHVAMEQHCGTHIISNGLIACYGQPERRNHGTTVMR